MDAVFGKQIGQYALLEKLGEGGMAAVYNAFDMRQERNVALKLILPSRQTSQVFLERFIIEARSLAQLSHINIVRVLDYGEVDGIPFLVMEYIPGGTLKELMGNPIPWAQAAAILAPIARALEYVHKQKIIHRDVKPSNILLDENDTPLLSDFGVVKLLETNETPDMLATGVGIGTPDYMSPEQGIGKDVDSRADIYALGVVFYEMLTGQKPFTAESPMAVVIQHVTGAFPRPKMSAPDLPRFVDETVMKAVAKDPNQRFQWMGDFAEALEQLALGERANKRLLNQVLNRRRACVVELSDEKTLAEVSVTRKNEPTTNAPAAKKPARPRAIWVRATLLGIMAILLVGAGMVFAFRKPLAAFWTTSSQIAGTQIANLTSSGNKVRTSTTQPVIVATTRLAPTKASPTAPEKPTVAGKLPKASPTALPTPEPASEAAPAATTLPPEAIDTPLLLQRPVKDSYLTKTKLIGMGGVTSIGWSDDGQTLLLSTTEGIFGIDPSSLMRVWHADIEKRITTLRTEKGNTFITGLHDGEVSFWKFGSQAPENFDDISSPQLGSVSALAGTSDEKLLAVGWQSGGFAVYERQGESLKKRFAKSWAQRVVSGLAFDPDGSHLFLASDNTLLEVWDIAGQNLIATYDVGMRFTSIASFDNNLLLYGKGLSAMVFGQAEGRVLYYFNNVGANITTAAVSPDHQLVAYGLADGRVKVYEMPKPGNPQSGNKERLALKGHPDSITALAFSPDSKMLASASLQKSLVLWDSSGTELSTLESNSTAVRRIVISPNGDQMVVQFDGDTVILYNMSGEPVKEYTGVLPEGAVFSNSNEYMVIAKASGAESGKGILSIISLPTGEEIQTLLGYGAGWVVGFSEDEKLLASGYNLAAYIWDTSTWNKVETRRTVDSGCGIFSSADGMHLATFWNNSVSFGNQPGGAWCNELPEFASPLYLLSNYSNAIYQMRTGELWIWNFSESVKNKLALQTQHWEYRQVPHTLLAVSYDNSQFLWNQSNQTIVLSELLSNSSTHDQNDGLIIKDIEPFDYCGAIAPNGELVVLGSKYGTISFWSTSQ